MVLCVYVVQLQINLKKNMNLALRLVSSGLRLVAVYVHACVFSQQSPSGLKPMTLHLYDIHNYILATSALHQL